MEGRDISASWGKKKKKLGNPWKVNFVSFFV